MLGLDQNHCEKCTVPPARWPPRTSSPKFRAPASIRVPTPMSTSASIWCFPAGPLEIVPCSSGSCRLEDHKSTRGLVSRSAGVLNGRFPCSSSNRRLDDNNSTLGSGPRSACRLNDHNSTRGLRSRSAGARLRAQVRSTLVPVARCTRPAGAAPRRNALWGKLVSVQSLFRLVCELGWASYLLHTSTVCGTRPGCCCAGCILGCRGSGQSWPRGGRRGQLRVIFVVLRNGIGLWLEDSRVKGLFWVGGVGRQ